MNRRSGGRYLRAPDGQRLADTPENRRAIEAAKRKAAGKGDGNGPKEVTGG